MQLMRLTAKYVFKIDAAAAGNCNRSLQCFFALLGNFTVDKTQTAVDVRNYIHHTVISLLIVAVIINRNSQISIIASQCHQASHLLKII